MSDLLARRMLSLQLDRNAVARLVPDTLTAMQRLCATCDSREQCALGLADDFADVSWRACCPAAAMLTALGELPWFRLAAA